jgi:hypothetical protein
VQWAEVRRDVPSRWPDNIVRCWLLMVDTHTAAASVWEISDGTFRVVHTPARTMMPHVTDDLPSEHEAKIMAESIIDGKLFVPKTVLINA